MQDSIEIRGLHHVTATVADSQEDLDFYAGLLGMRLVKKTVNFDNHNVYHFYYGTERGAPGTLMTTFPYKGWGVRAGVQGAGQITATAFSVPEGAMGLWRARLGGSGLSDQTSGVRFGEEWISFRDPSGLVIELVANGNDSRTPWVSNAVSSDTAIRGLHGVTLSVRNPDPTLGLLTAVLGWTILGEEAGRTRVQVEGGQPGRTIDVLEAPDAPDGVNGLGTVHHVAMAVDDEAAQLHARDRLLQAGLRVTEVLDRQYFKSIYFREPGGVLYEIATLGPGFLVDEPLERLGTGLKLPPWEEPHRSAIEEQLVLVQH